MTGLKLLIISLFASFSVVPFLKDIKDHFGEYSVSNILGVGTYLSLPILNPNDYFIDLTIKAGFGILTSVIAAHIIFFSKYLIKKHFKTFKDEKDND